MTTQAARIANTPDTDVAFKVSQKLADRIQNIRAQGDEHVATVAHFRDGSCIVFLPEGDHYAAMSK